jgi:hypothetical protein
MGGGPAARKGPFTELTFTMEPLFVIIPLIPKPFPAKEKP